MLMIMDYKVDSSDDDDDGNDDLYDHNDNHVVDDDVYDAVNDIKHHLIQY